MYGVYSHHMQAREADKQESPRDAAEQTHEVLNRHFDGRLRVIAKQSVTYCFNQDRLDKLLAQYIGCLDGCELIYAIEARIGPSRSESINHRHADFRFGVRRSRAIFFSTLPGSPLRGLHNCAERCIAQSRKLPARISRRYACGKLSETHGTHRPLIRRRFFAELFGGPCASQRTICAPTTSRPTASGFW